MPSIKRIMRAFTPVRASWKTIIEKFEKLAEPYTSKGLREQIIDMVQDFENHSVKELMKLLVDVKLKM
ncbi:hypothetical protein [Rhodohalobacter sp.]|uniref:hypothetical protein n=1 Tax=Rhodohalobacter sp. TaxID=1974210 RepID=UPI002ACEDFFD|nr:hypothetical protein [Rhodohalobacter sp.]MDZ7757283.1 hypothetical protein [Rhodohalobacter sp.]